MHIVVYSPIILYIIAGVFLGTDTQIVLRYTNTQEGSERGLQRLEFFGGIGKVGVINVSEA